MGKTVFLDRDGVINACAGEHDYIRTWREFRILDGAAEGIRMLNQEDYQVIVVTNQRGVARGLMTAAALNDIHTMMCKELQKKGASIDAIFVCMHDDEECDCRKPKIGLFLQAEQGFSIDKHLSWMIGDSFSDMEAGRRYGIRTVLIGGANTVGKQRANLAEAAKMILESERT